MYMYVSLTMYVCVQACKYVGLFVCVDVCVCVYVCHVMSCHVMSCHVMSCHVMYVCMEAFRPFAVKISRSLPAPTLPLWWFKTTDHFVRLQQRGIL